MDVAAGRSASKSGSSATWARLYGEQRCSCPGEQLRLACSEGVAEAQASAEVLKTDCGKEDHAEEGLVR